MSTPAALPWIQFDEDVVAENEPNGHEDVANRPLKFIITQSDFDLTDVFPGFMARWTGTASPEGVTEAPAGHAFVDTSAARLYIKMTPSGNTGWQSIGGNASGDNSPEGVITASVGALYEQRNAGATAFPVWVKRSGTGNTGWRKYFAGGGGDNTITVGEGATTAATNTVDGIAIGLNAAATGTATATGPIAIGSGAVATSGTDGAIAIGKGATATGDGALAFGPNTSSTATDTITIGVSLTNAAAGSIAIGGAIGTSTNAIAIGGVITLTATGAVCIGLSSTVANGSTNAVAIGNAATCAGTFTTAVGRGATASATTAVAIGNGSSAAASGAIAIASNNVVIPNTGTNSIAIGNGHTLTGMGANVVAIGNAVVTGSNAGNVIIGNGSSLNGSSGVAISATCSTGGSGVGVYIGSTVSGGTGGGGVVIGGTCSVNTGCTAVGTANNVGAANAIVIGAFTVGAGGTSAIGHGTGNISHANCIVLGSHTSFQAQMCSIGLNASSLGINTLMVGHGTDTQGSPVSLLFRLTNGSGTNNVAGNLTCQPGLSTGNAAEGQFKVQTGDAGASGTTVQTATVKFVVGRTVAVGNALDANAALNIGLTATCSLIAPNGRVLLGTSTLNTFNLGGLTIQQSANSDEILTLKSTDVAHGMTTQTDTDVYGTIRRVAAADGGLRFTGYTEVTIGINFRGAQTTETSTRSTAGLAPVIIDGLTKSGTTVATPAADTNILAVRAGTTTRFILDSDGDSFQDVGTAWTNFDTHDDVALLNKLSAHVTRRDDPLRLSFGRWLDSSRQELENLKLVTFNDDGHHFVNMSRLTMLHTGALRQLGEKLSRIEGMLQKLLPAEA